MSPLQRRLGSFTVSAMLFRSLWCGLLLVIGLGFSGCDQSGEDRVDEQKNPYFLAGKERVAERDYKGAIEAFEKAIEGNPRSPQAHFELGMLYEHSEKEEDYVSAMYHYQQAIKLRPNDYPADNARQRITFCKREVVKAESLAPVAQNLMRELDRLKEENRLLRARLEPASTQPAGRTPILPRAPANRQEIMGPASPIPLRTSNGPANVLRNPPRLSSQDRITPLPPLAPAARTHTVKSGDTPYSIARQYHLKLEALMSANPAIDPKRLKIDQIIAIPSS